jgi:ATP-dependent RNA helicase RhlE
MKFTDLPLSPGLQHRLKSAGFETPTPIQSATIPLGLGAKDIVATAQTGTGKTLAFLIPAIEKLSATQSRQPQILVLVPTRELAMQVHAVYEQLRGKLPQAALVIGGLSERRQIDALRRGARVIVATPGRLEDFLSRRLVDLSQVQILVLDEADRMLDMGFLPAIRRILAATPKSRQTLCFSATMPPAISGIVADYMRTPERITIGSTSKPASTVELHAFEVTQANKLDALRQLLYAEKGQTLIFAKTKRGTERLAKNLVRDGFSATMIHGDRTQAQRTRALNEFVQGTTKVLVATDVAARGLDVPEVAHVINYDLPQVAEDFIHRVGRTGRAGAKGRASTLVSAAENIELRNIERTMKLRIERRDIKELGDSEYGQKLVSRNTLASRSLSALPGERFV